MRIACCSFLVFVFIIVFSVNRDRDIESTGLSMTEAGLEREGVTRVSGFPSVSQ